MSQVTITINTNPKLNPLRLLCLFGMQVVVIGIGVFANSAAMQWAGFVMLLLLLFFVAMKINEKDQGLTFDQARARIDELEGQETGRSEAA